MDSRRTSTCLNCNTPTTGDFCPSCGQDCRERRLTFRRVLKDTFEQVLDLELPMLRTMIGLTWRPGWVAAEYVRGRREAFTNPLKYCIVCAAIIALYIRFVGVEGMLRATVTGDESREQVAVSLAGVIDYLGPLTAMMLPVLAVFMRLLFFRSGRNTMEFYVLALYAYGHTFLVQLIFLGTHLVSVPGVNIVYGLLPIAYFAIASLQFSEGRWWVNLILSTLAHALFYVVFIVVMSIGLSIFGPMLEQTAAAG